MSTRAHLVWSASVDLARDGPTWPPLVLFPPPSPAAPIPQKPTKVGHYSCPASMGRTVSRPSRQARAGRATDRLPSSFLRVLARRDGDICAAVATITNPRWPKPKITIKVFRKSTDAFVDEELVRLSAMCRIPLLTRADTCQWLLRRISSTCTTTSTPSKPVTLSRCRPERLSCRASFAGDCPRRVRYVAPPLGVTHVCAIFRELFPAAQ